VAAFHEYAKTTAYAINSELGPNTVTPERIEAMLFGRWHNGTPLVSHSTCPGPDNDPDMNQFAYAHKDLDGMLCPHFAHIRKVNPRDAPTDLVGEARTLTLQPFRRGIPYRKDGEEGLLFLAYMTGIVDRFGALSMGWMNRANAPEPTGHGWDMIAGQNAADEPRVATLRIDGREFPIDTDERWVEPTGGGYFFAPSLPLLRSLADGAPRMRSAAAARPPAAAAGH
jgi:deferrochelatase/peroxidase EfeB